MTVNGDEQYERGLEALRQADGGAGQRLLEALADVSPELSYRSVAWSYGDLYVRPELQSVVYCGVPRAVNATLVAKKVFAERNLLPVRSSNASG